MRLWICARNHWNFQTWIWIIKLYLLVMYFMHFLWRRQDAPVLPEKMCFVKNVNLWMCIFRQNRQKCSIFKKVLTQLDYADFDLLCIELCNFIIVFFLRDRSTLSIVVKVISRQTRVTLSVWGLQLNHVFNLPLCVVTADITFYF